jgi:hypothetical protein
MRTGVTDSIDSITAADWNRVSGIEQPFLRHEFLAALERHGCVGAAYGWLPRHVLAYDASGRLTGAVPLYLKNNSYGEFVFDWAWADAYQRAGMAYYPKLVAAIPYTPVTGPRLLVRPGADRDAVAAALIGQAQAVAQQAGVSSLHWLFTDPRDTRQLVQHGHMRRTSCHFHWHNKGYASFEDYLAALSSRKRKKLRRERRRVQESGIVFRTLHGDDIDPQLWRIVFGFSERTFLRHGNAHYLSPQFFELLSERMPGSVMVKLAERAGHAIGAAIFLRGADGLYGRYWGSEAYEDSLHFEACYYQGIEYCIAEGLASFDPGTQGEHKLARGFQPVLTKSAHWLAHPAFAGAIARYLERERDAVRRYAEAAADHLPFQRAPAP